MIDWYYGHVMDTRSISYTQLDHSCRKNW